MILIPTAALTAIAEAARAAYPEECCGLLVGRCLPDGNIRILRAVHARNIAADRRRRFEVDPARRIALERELRERRQMADADAAEEIVGHFHSHPDGAPVPSARDAAAVLEPDLIWLVAAVERQGQPAIAAHKYDAARRLFHPVPLRIQP